MTDCQTFSSIDFKNDLIQAFQNELWDPTSRGGRTIEFPSRIESIITNQTRSRSKVLKNKGATHSDTN